jgi:chromosome segregation ATPase
MSTILGATARDITTNNGKVYKDVEIKAKSNGITIFHNYGASFEKFDNLPKAIQEEFHYDKAKVKRYEEQLKLKKEKIAKKRAKRLLLLQQRQQEALKAKKLLIQQQKEKIAKIKPLIQQAGQPVTLNRQVLYNLRGKPLFASSKLIGNAKFFLAYEDYMLVNDTVYLVKDNVTSVSNKLTKLTDKVKAFTKSITTKGHKITQLQKRVDVNDEKIAKAQQVIDNYNRNNEADDNIRKTQKRLIRQYTRNNRELNRNIKKAQNRIKLDKKKLKQAEIDFTLLTNGLKQFNQARTIAKTTKIVKPAVKQVEVKLKKLKVLLDKKLISQAIYDKKSAEIMAKYLK